MSSGQALHFGRQRQQQQQFENKPRNSSPNTAAAAAAQLRGTVDGSPLEEELQQKQQSGMATSTPLRSASAACDALGISTSAASASTPIHKQQQQEPIVGTPDSAVLNRMVELESAIATVKSSLDNHASSYFSVASQIAELNARIGKLGVSQSSSSASALGHREPSSPSRSEPQTSNASNSGSGHTQDTPSRAALHAGEDEASGRGSGGDEQYNRIQEMIDSLIKDANSALSSKPDIHRAAASGYSDDCVDFPSNDSPFASKDISRTVSAPFDEAATLVVDTDFARKHHHSPYVATASEIKRPVSRSTTRRAFDYSSDHLLARRPASAHGMSVKGRRHLVPRTHAMAGSCESSSDPTEADGESDGYLGAMSTAGHYHVRHSRHHRSSGRHLDRRTSSNRFVRYRSDTTDSLVSNSSETCVAPSTRVSRELHRPSMASTYSQPPTTVDALCTPGRASFGMGGDEAMFSEQQQQRRRQPIEQSPALSASRMHEFPRLVQDEYEGGAHRRSYSRDDTYAGSIPLIRRFRNSVTRVALKSASLVDESVSNDIAAYESSGRGSMDGVHQPRMRSNTSVSEISTVFTPPRHPAMAADYGYQMPTSAGIESPVWERRDLLLDDAHVYPSSFHEEPAASSPLLWTRRHRSTMGSPGIAASSDEIPRKRWSLEASPGSERSSIEYSPEIDPRGYSSQTAGAMYQHQQLRTALSSGHPVRRPDSIEEYDSSCESNAVEKSRGGHEVATAGSTSATGLIGMVSLLYWTLLFTLGALMLDSFLCQVAGKRVMGTVDKIAQAEAASDDGDSRKKKGLVSMDRAAPAGRRPEADGANVANTVGRFVRWYVEGPEEQLLQKGQQSPRPTAGAAGAGRGGLGLGSSGQQPRSLRARKPSAMRGTFKHVG